MIVEDAGNDLTRLNEIWSLYRANARILGFMPRGAFEEAANERNLIVATNGSFVCGYVLYDLRRGRIVLTHLCIHDSVRGTGLARTFIEELKARHPNQEGIVLTCRNDFEAHKIWPRLDFEPVSEGLGRSKEGFLKTKWLLDFGHPNLLSLLEETDRRIRIAVDTDVFIDLVEDRPESQTSRALITGWAAEVSTVVVTKTIRQEMSNNSEPAVRTRRRSQLNSFSRAERASDDWNAIQTVLKEELSLLDLSSHDQFDLENVSRTAAAGIGFFASRDWRLIQRYKDKAWDLFQLRVGTPADILGDLWHELSEPYVPAAIENTSFMFSTENEFSDDELYRIFSNRVLGEKKKAFEMILRKCRREPNRWQIRVLRSNNEAPVALLARAQFDTHIEIPLLRVAGRHSATVGRQIAHIIRDEGLRSGATSIRINDSAASPQLTECLLAEGFVESGTDWMAHIINVHATSNDAAEEIQRRLRLDPGSGLGSAMTQLRNNELSSSEILELERIFCPLKVKNSHIPTFVVPIKAIWAEQLFDSILSASTLFHRHDQLGISREHVYYSGAPPGSLGPPARILWYVSKEPKRQGTGSVRAVSVVEEVVVGRALDLFRRFNRLGIYERKQVLDAASKTGRIMAIRFSQTELFDEAIPYDEFKAMLGEVGHKLVVRSPQKLPDEIFDVVYERGMRATD
jgi:hypothetical protein